VAILDIKAEGYAWRIERSENDLLADLDWEGFDVREGLECDRLGDNPHAPKTWAGGIKVTQRRKYYPSKRTNEIPQAANRVVIVWGLARAADRVVDTESFSDRLCAGPLPEHMSFQ